MQCISLLARAYKHISASERLHWVNTEKEKKKAREQERGEKRKEELGERKTLRKKVKIRSNQNSMRKIYSRKSRYIAEEYQTLGPLTTSTGWREKRREEKKDGEKKRRGVLPLLLKPCKSHSTQHFVAFVIHSKVQ